MERAGLMRSFGYPLLLVVGGSTAYTGFRETVLLSTSGCPRGSKFSGRCRQTAVRYDSEEGHWEVGDRFSLVVPQGQCRLKEVKQ